MESGWIFPYGNVKKDSRVIIYGAGKIGKSFYDQIQATQYCRIILWVDRKAENYRGKGLDVVGTEHLEKAGQADKILIAIDSEMVCEEVLHVLVERYGIEKDRIWTPFTDRNGETDGRIDIKRYYFAGQETVDDYKFTDINLEKLDVAFVIPAPIQGGGGHRNIFRVVKHLASVGHKVTVYYIQTDLEAEIVKENVSSWFYDMSNVSFVKYSGTFDFHDAGIATWWETAYMLNAKRNHFRKQLYFVQDYEAYFYPMSSEYILAENSYNLGMFHICSGQWCKELIEKKFNAKAVYFQFPIDKAIYYQRKRTKQNKNIVFFAKPDMPRRCFEIGLGALEIFNRLRPDVEIILFGSPNLTKGNIPFKATIRNIIPTLDELAEMYSNADIGIVFSPTNPSLVPYEMMSCGCPVVDLDLNDAIYKYGNDGNNVFLLPVDAGAFAKRLSEIMDHASLLATHILSGKQWVEAEFPSEIEMETYVEQVIKDRMCEVGI